MRYVTPSILFALVTLGCVLLFLWWYCAARGGASPLAHDSLLSQLGARPVSIPATQQRLSFAGKLHPMERRDRIAALLITLVYAVTAFFQLGDTRAPQNFYDFGERGQVTIALSGEPLNVQGIRYYTGLGVGGRVSGEDGRAYNVEVSADGENWYTLWQKKEDPEDASKVTGYYWADAADFSPSFALTQKYNQLFKWLEVKTDAPAQVRYLRITGNAQVKYLEVRSGPDSVRSEPRYLLELGRLCLLDEAGEPIPFHWAMADGSPIPEALTELFSVDELVPERSTWHNSTYFDEIYHARTAKENINGVYPYEWTHPPLGKLILSVGIRLFGMTPFGWRFMGALFGVGMLPILYVFLKNMFGKTPAAACGTILFACEFMHLTQTRIATIDTYAVFFILAMYFFMYRYLTLPAGTPFSRGALPLFLSGLMWGLGMASKWTVIYGALGLAVVYFMGFYQKMRDWPEEGEVKRGLWVVQTLLFSVFCFILMPLCIYTASYLPYAQALGVDLSLGNTLSGAGRSLPVLFQNLWERFFVPEVSKLEGYRAAAIPNDSLAGIMAKNQWDMLTYHQGVGDFHPYSSRWFQWIVNARPILYYMDNEVSGFTTRFAAFANPVVCWGGLGAILICACHSFRRLWSKAAFLTALGLAALFFIYHSELEKNNAFWPEQAGQVLNRNWIILIACLLLYLALRAFLLLHAPGYDGKAAFIFVAYLSQLAPWWLIGRTTFEYHYFPSILFLVFALTYLFNGLMEADRGWRVPVYGLTALAAALYLLFYPVLIGLTIPTWYEPLVKWIESWPF